MTTQGRARALVRELKRLVVDNTGLDQTFGFELNYAPEGDTSSGRPSLFTAVEKTLGLKLTAGKASVEYFIVESAQRIPSEN